MTEINRIPSIGEGFQKEGKRWRVTDTTAGVITLNSRTETRTLYPSQLMEYQPFLETWKNLP